MAYYGSLGDIDIGAISKSISDTAVDIFVYDTRKDSDGGAWRKRTQHTSWYNETLNTATRGSRRDFPAVAVIVAESAKVTIYDGDDPDMPMWMVFNTTDGSILRSGLITSIWMLNAELWVSHGSGSGIHWVNFLKDTARWITGSSSYGGFFIKRDISRRNESGENYYNNIGGASDITIAESSINDVAMTVLPNAPIDSATGLPVPTIAVATSGGASVIKDDGTVANIGGTITTKIDINQKLIFTASTANGGYYGFTTDGLSSINAFFRTVGNLRILSNVNTNTNNNLVVPNSSNLYSGQTVGLSLVYKNGLSNDNYDGMVSYITSSYNTGWLHGDIKGAFLSDISTTSVTGTELNQYGDFASTTGWGSRSAAWTISGGVASVSSGAGYQLLGLTSGTLTNGRKYAVTVNVTAFTAGRLELSQANSSNIQFNLGSTGAKTLIFTYTGTTGYALGIYGYGDASYAFTIDDLYVRELSEADRSVNNTGLAVYGTITKTPVATGSNLVAYSGWSKSNYLLRPEGITDLNNSSMTFMTWYKCSSISAEEALISTGDYSTVSEVRALYITPSGVAGFSGWGNDFTPGSRSVRDDVWHHLAFTLQYISGNSYVVSIYVDGVLTGTSERGLLTFSNTVIDIGGGTLPLDRFARGSLALSRVSTSVVSASQMLKIYNDEKVLFQPNSQCTLYGSSDAVTALAYDDTTKLLHVGTSSGRSDFQGLERVANTTTAVTTAISASNGLIAEQ